MYFWNFRTFKTFYASLRWNIAEFLGISLKNPEVVFAKMIDCEGSLINNTEDDNSKIQGEEDNE